MAIRQEESQNAKISLQTTLQSGKNEQSCCEIGTFGHINLYGIPMNITSRSIKEGSF
jgi:hypothetical protein